MRPNLPGSLASTSSGWACRSDQGDRGRDPSQHRPL